jgi:hypothetical protein
MITFSQKGDFSRLSSYLERLKNVVKLGNLDAYGREGVAALSSMTPRDTGETAKSWYYKINRENDTVTLSFHNSHVNNGVNIAIILQYGHGTKNGGYVEGIDYINPAIRPIFNKIAEDAWKEVTRA